MQIVIREANILLVFILRCLAYKGRNVFLQLNKALVKLHIQFSTLVHENSGEVHEDDPMYGTIALRNV